MVTYQQSHLYLHSPLSVLRSFLNFPTERRVFATCALISPFLFIFCYSSPFDFLFFTLLLWLLILSSQPITFSFFVCRIPVQWLQSCLTCLSLSVDYRLRSLDVSINIVRVIYQFFQVLDVYWTLSVHHIMLWRFSCYFAIHTSVCLRLIFLVWTVPMAVLSFSA